MARLSNFTHLFSSIQAKSVFNTPPSVFSSPTSSTHLSQRPLAKLLANQVNFDKFFQPTTESSGCNRALTFEFIEADRVVEIRTKREQSRTYDFPSDKYGMKLECHSCIIQIQKYRSSPAFVRSTARGATLLHRRCPLPHTATYLLASLLHCSQCYQPRHHH